MIMPFEHTLSPVIFSIGPFALRWYSLVYVIGFLLGYWVLLKVAERGYIKNLDKQAVESFIVWLIIGGIGMGRLFYCIVYNPAYYAVAPWKILFIWEGGISFHGGIIGAVIAGWWFCRKYKVSFFSLADVTVLPLSFIHIFGRLANYINGELVGTATDVAWCVNYPNDPSVEGCRHPSQFYEAAKNLVVFLIITPLYLKLHEKLKDGTIFWLYFVLTGFGRVITDIWRAPDPTDFTLAATGLAVGQWLSLLMGAMGLAGLVWLYWPKLLKRQGTRK